MIGISGDDPHAVDLVAVALQRSVSSTMVSRAASADETIGVIVNARGRLERQSTSAQKLIVFGALPDALARDLGVGQASRSLDPSDAVALPARSHQFRESPLAVHYNARAAILGGRAWRRPFVRYDFADEWNNLGFGAIRCDRSIWSVGPAVDAATADEIASVVDTRSGRLCSYAALFDRGDRSILWVNRSVGPIDSFEWRLVENFLSAHRSDQLPVVPVLSEIPAGHDALIVARLDCDEEIESARPLWSAYRDWDVPLSLAIHTNMLTDGPIAPLLRDAAAAPGSILSHSATHAAQWGGSYDAALREASASADAIARAIGSRPRYAVSPFHQSPDYALAALRDAGYAGCIGGNISADPAFNLARGGSLAGLSEGFVGQTGQCMLHGDCLLAGADPLATYREAFDLADETRSLFAYLDHPFSTRYQYGWKDEGSRIAAHRALLDHIGACASRPLFLTSGAAMDFLQLRARTHLTSTEPGITVEMPSYVEETPKICVDYRGNTIDIANGARIA